MRELLAGVLALNVRIRDKSGRANAVLAIEDALHNLRHRPVLLRCSGIAGGSGVRCKDVRQHVASVLVSEDLPIGKRKEEGLADAEGG